MSIRLKTLSLFNKLLSAAILVLLISLPAPASVADLPPGILLISSWDSHNPYTEEFASGINSQLEQQHADAVVYNEILDSARVLELDQELFARHIQQKYQQTRIDIVIADNVPASRFLSSHPELFPQALRGYYGANDFPPGSIRDTDIQLNATPDYAVTLRQALSMTQAKQLYHFAEDISPLGKRNLSSIKQALDGLVDKPQVTILKNLPYAELCLKVAKLPKDSIITAGLYFSDQQGNSHTPYQFESQIAECATAPVFTFWASHVGNGSVGGHLYSHAAISATFIKALLAARNNEPPELEDFEFYRDIYDARQLERWDIPLSRVPKNATILYAEPSFVDKYLWETVAVAIIFALLLILLVSITATAQRRKKLLVDLDNERTLMKTIMDTSPIAVGISQNGIVQFSNPTMRQVSGLYEGDPTSRVYVNPEDQQKVMRLLGEFGRVDGLEVKMRHTERGPVDAMLHVNLIKYQGEDALLFWCTDISQLTQTQKELEHARKMAEESSQLKSDFLANMSHEIRTPMNAVIGFSYLLLQSELKSEQRGHIEKIQKSAQGLLAIINDILDFSQLETGQFYLEKSRFTLHDIFNNLSDIHGLAAEDKQLELVYQIAPQVPIQLLGDRMRLEQILLNLTSNALKFTAKGEVLVSVDIDSETDRQVTLRFIVSDSGIGMSEEQVNKLFAPYRQGDMSASKQYAGTGLGLSICRKLIDLMDGELWLESNPGSGSKIYFTLKFEKVREETALPLDAGKNLKERRVLVVDDNEIARVILVNILETLGMQVSQTDCAYRALDLLQEMDQIAPFDLMLLDWQLPDLDGIALAEKIERDKSINAAPAILLITGFNREIAMDAAKHVKIAGFLNKPVTVPALLDGITKALGQNGLPSTTDSRKPRNLKDNIKAVKGAKILLVEDNPVNLELARAMLTSNGVLVSTAVNGQEALDLLDKEQFDGVLMDCQMPVMDGYTATRKLRAQDRFKDLPILALTANTMAADRNKAFKAGMNDHIGKPIDIEDLFRSMAQWIKKEDATTLQD